MLFLFWRGWGIIVTIVAVVASVFLGDLVIGEERAENFSGAILVVALMLTAVVVWKWGRRVNANGVRVLHDPATGQEVKIRNLHTLFFLRMEYWAVPLAGLAVLLLLLLVQIFAGGGAGASEVQTGGLYTVEDGSDYRVVKVLDFDDDVVHLRLYANEYAQRPATVAANDLDTGTTESSSVGIGHIPLTRKGYEEMKPVFLYQDNEIPSAAHAVVASWDREG